jgi:hypothetical protein
MDRDWGETDTCHHCTDHSPHLLLRLGYADKLFGLVAVQQKACSTLTLKQVRSREKILRQNETFFRDIVHHYGLVIPVLLFYAQEDPLLAWLSSN